MNIIEKSASCLLCPHHCRLKPGQTGRCHARANQDGEIISSTYGEVAAWHLDPIEKKPLYHFYPGSKIFSVAGYGCNLSCSFCQNYEISQSRQPGKKITPEILAEMAKDSLGVCFTYSEPGIWFEMIRDTAPLVKNDGGKVVLVSNGILEPRFIEELIPWIDAVNIDIKAFNNEFYERYCGGNLNWVLDNVERLSGRVHLEITTLIIPDANDSSEEIKELAKWLSQRAPLAWHLSRYFPAYKINVQPTDITKLKMLWELAQDYLPYVYLGNVYGGSTTYCPKCKEAVIIRDDKVKNTLRDGTCAVCGFEIFGIGL